MNPTVVVIGGGYGGITAAQALDDVADVILIDPKDSFVHNVASLRAIVDADWAEKLFFPYGRLLKRGRIIHDWVVSVDSRGVHLSSQQRVAADYIIVATGTTYPFPAKVNNYHAEAGKSRIRQVSAELARAGSVLLLGAGPVGLELSGEIKAAWPHKAVTIIDPAPDILSGSFIAGFDPQLRDELRKRLRDQLHALGIELLLGNSLRREPPTPAGKAGSFTTVTATGRPVSADIWLRCFGRQPASGCLANDLSGARRMDGRVSVTEHLRLAGQRNIFAIGDVTHTDALDTAVVAMEQGGLVAENIQTLMGGGGDLKPFRASQPFLLLPLGPKGGASYSPDDGILDAATTAIYKGDDLLIPKYSEIFGNPDSDDSRPR